MLLPEFPLSLLNMGKIRLLPERVINQIAAGEVVQRPASVVKELMENSIDAGASSIDVILENAGKKLIQVKDNGIGMSPEDARMCFERHATSKIADIEDLYKLHSLGFRGEALASIASVAQVELKTRRKIDELGTLVKVEGGKVISYERIQTFQGTSLKVEHLFYNIPARKNFLRSDSTEMKHILNIYIPLALSHPEIATQLQHNRKVLYKLPAGNLQERISALFPRLKKEQLLEVNFEDATIKLLGFIGSPEAAQIQKSHFFFVNGRFIKNHYLHKVILEAYGSMLEKDKHPFYVLFLEVHPEKVDVNIHPTKTEVQFENLLQIGQAVKQAILKTFGLDYSSLHTFGGVSFPSRTHNFSPKESKKLKTEHFNFSEKSKISPGNWEKFITEHLKPDSETETFSSVPMSSLFPSEANEAKELFVSNKGLILLLGKKLKVYYVSRIYQRLTFDKLRQGISRIPVQNLLYPIKMLVTRGEIEILEKYKSTLKDYGFSFEVGEMEMQITGFPAILQEENIEEVFRNLWGLLAEPYDSAEKLRNEVFKFLALHTRTQIPKNKTEAEELLREYEKAGAPLFAPDGKPIVKEMEM